MQIINNGMRKGESSYYYVHINKVKVNSFIEAARGLLDGITVFALAFDKSTFYVW